MKSLTKKLRGQYFRKAVIYFLTFCLVLNTSLPAVMATPSGGAFTVGTGTIVEGANTAVTVNQAQSIIQWGAPGSGGIDTSSTESLTFSQGSLSNSAVLNRIMSGNPTQFDGTLNALGMNIFVVNPAGIVFGNGSQVNVTQLVASSLDISNQNFLDGHYEFSASGDYLGAVVNNGAITAAQGAALLGKKILNTGTITTTGPGGFVVMAAGNRVLLGQPASNIVVEMDSVTPADPANPDGLGNVTNASTGTISAPAGTIVLAAGDLFSTALRVESGVGRVVQNGRIHADGTSGATGNGGSVTLTAGDAVVLGTGSQTTAKGGTSNSGASGGEVIAYASELYKDNALVDFQTGAQINVKGGSPSDPATVGTSAKFNGGVAELSGDHLYFNGSVDATSTPYQRPDPANPGSTITVTPKGGTLHIDPVNLTLANGAIPTGGAAMDTFYEKQLEAYSQAGVNTILEADYDITVENITDGVIQGGKGDIVLRTVYNTGGIEFLPATPGGPIKTTVRTVGGGNIFMLAGSGGIKTGRLETLEDGGNPGRIRIYTNNGGDIETRALRVDGGNDVEVSIIASGNLTIDGRDDAGTIQPGVLTSTNKVPSKEDKVGTAYICLVSETGNVNVIGAVEVEAHGKEQTVARIHIDADNTVSVHTRNGRVQAIAKTSSSGTADAQIKIHAGSSEPGAITIIRDAGGRPIRIQANTSGASIGPLDFSVSDFLEPNPDTYEQTSAGSSVLVQIADTWLEDCPDCPTPPDLPPPVEPPQHAPIAVDDGYVIGKGDILLIILDADGVLGNDSDPDGDTIIAILLGGGATGKGGTVILLESGGFEYTPPTEKLFDEYGSDAGGDYALFIDSFEYHLQDEGGLNSNSATVTITAKNYIPVAQADSYNVVHNVELSRTVDQGIIVGVVPAVNGDTDFDGDSLTPYLLGGSTTGATDLGGTVTLNPDGSFVYTPPADTVGTDSFTYYASDGYNNSESVEVTIELTNTAPVAQPDSYEVVHNVTLDLTQPGSAAGVIEGVLPENADYDADPGDTLTAVLVDGGSTLLGGSVTLNADGSFTYTPPADTVDADSFTYYVTDGYSNSDPVQVTINLTNTSPVAQPDSYGVAHNVVLERGVDQGVIVGVIPAENGDYDLDAGDVLTPYLSGGLTTGPTVEGGTVTLNPDGSFSYTPPADWVGTDSFTYYVSDNYGGLSEEVQVSIQVGNSSPVAQADSYEVLHNVTLSREAGQGIIIGVVPAINGDYDDDGDALTPYLPGALTTGPTNLGGIVTLNPDGSFTYTPPENTVGTDSFTYYVTDGYSNSAPVQVTINLTNTLPIARPDSYTVAFDTPLSPTADLGIITGVVPAVNGDYDPDPGDSLTPYLPGALATGSTARGGTVTLNPDGSFTYTPATSWTGTDSFTYYVTDSYGNSEPVLVTMFVGSAPPVPVVPFVPAAPGLEPVKIEISGCPALMAWTAAELGVDEGALQIRIASGLASGMAIQPCDACTGLKQAATILQDAEGAHIAALAQVINELASNTAPPTEEQMASIASAIAMNAGADNQYAVAGQYLDALAKYVGILNNQMGFSTAESIQLATDKYIGPLAEGQNAGVVAYVAARLAALGG